MPGLPIQNSHSDSDDESPYDEGSTDDEQPIHSDDSSEVEELRPEEFPTYFSERDGRLFHSHPNAPYPLPVDGPEQDRLNRQHRLLYRIFGSHHFGPVAEVLAPTEDGRRRMVLDLCTGTGKWVMDMGHLFPEVLLRGVDIVPIATRYPLANVQFEIHDVSQQLRWSDGTFDFVHARDLSMAIRNWPALLNEVARLLRPGGLFLSCEWGLHTACQPDRGIDLPVHAPASIRFFEAVRNALLARQVEPIAHAMPYYLTQSPYFGEVRVEPFYIAIGGWPEGELASRLGHRYKGIHQRFANSVASLLKEFGMTEIQAAQLIADYLQELDTVEGLASIYYTTYARRV
ncbi:hypothetical protein AX17_003815 [Amanita inopinata Kibby_2008]|nr:hypothetical protein AX17_003815 [Amanita inopinata Kibby_2008]